MTDSSMNRPEGQRPVPGPKPGATPRPGPRAGKAPHRPAVTAASPQTMPTNDPKKFGRIDENGQAYVRTESGERAIGEWKAGSLDEGYAHFGKRFDDVATEIRLLSDRLQNQPQEAESIRQAIEEHREALDSAPIMGNIPALKKVLAELHDRSYAAEKQAEKNRAERRDAAFAQKEALAAEAERIAAESTQWKEAGDRLRSILQEWKQIRGVERHADDELWKRYSGARDAFNKRRGAHFAELDRNRADAKKTKEQLVDEAESIQNSKDWNATAKRYAELMRQWKAAGRATRDVDDRLWERFRSAQDTFFDARRADAAKKDEEFAENAQRKQQLLDEYAGKIDPHKDLEQARTAMRELQDKWEEIGFVPRDRMREFEDKIRELEDKVSEAADAEWRRTDPEAQARVDQFRSRAQQLSQESEAAARKGNEKKAAELRAQAAQWEEWADTAAAAVEI